MIPAEGVPCREVLLGSDFKLLVLGEGRIKNVTSGMGTMRRGTSAFALVLVLGESGNTMWMGVTRGFPRHESPTSRGGQQKRR
jgi:hypothetical protein